MQSKTDPNFKGSLFEKLGLSDKLCPTCNAHLAQSGICLNACHLTNGQRIRMAMDLETIAKKLLDKNSGKVDNKPHPRR